MPENQTMNKVKDEPISWQKLIRTIILVGLYCAFTLLLELQFVSFYSGVFHIRGGFHLGKLFYSASIFPWYNEFSPYYLKPASVSNHPVLWVILYWYAWLTLPLVCFFAFLILKGTKDNEKRKRLFGVIGGCLLLISQWVLLGITILTETFGYPTSRVYWEITPSSFGLIYSLLAMIFLIVAGDIIHIQFKEELSEEQSKEQAILTELRQIRTSPEITRIYQLLEELTALPHLSQNTRHFLRYFQTHSDPEIRVATDALLLKKEEVSTK